MHSLTIQDLLDKGMWIGVGDAWFCEIKDCLERPTDTIYFTPDIKYLVCPKHFKEYLLAFNYKLAKEKGYV